MSVQPHSVVIDPIKMNIKNRVAPGGVSTGTLAFAGGLLMEGDHTGDVIVKNGPLCIMPGASMTGSITVHGDVYLFGRLGATGDSSELTVHGVLHLASKCEANGRIRYRKLAPYEGSKLNAQLETIRDETA